MSAREGILAQLATLAGTVAGATATRSRQAAATAAEGVVITVQPEAEEVNALGNAQLMSVRDLGVVFTVEARGAIPDQVADAVVSSLHEKLMADPTLGGRAARIIETDTRWDFAQAAANAVAVQLRYRIRYLTAAASLAAP